MAAVDMLRRATDTEQAWGTLFTRMDVDRDLYHNEQFRLTDKNGKPMKNVQNLTFNDAQTFGLRVIATLNSAEVQTVVQGKTIKKKAAATVEEFFRLLFGQADERLAARDMPSLRAFQNEMACIRGRIVTRVLLSQTGKDFIPDLIPVDPRFVVYGMGLHGLSWIAAKTIRDPEEVSEEYHFEPKTDAPVVWDIWDSLTEQVYIDGEQKFQQANPWHKPPWVVTSCASSLLTDITAFANRAESIYAADRNLYEPMNRIGSILYTEVGKLLKPPMQFRNRKGQAGKPPQQPPYGEAVTVPIATDEEFLNMPRSDLTQAGRLLIAMLEQRLQRGALPAVDYGNLTFPLSAVAIKGLQGARDQVFLPRLQALGTHFRDIARMVREQYIAGGFKAELGDAAGSRRVFPATEIKGDYDIAFKFNAVNPEQDVANYAIADAAKAWFGDEYILGHILQVDDPLEVMNQKWAELAPKTSELLAKVKMIRALIDTGDEFSAKLLAEEMKLNFEQLKSGKVTPQATPASEAIKNAQTGTPAVPLMGQRGAGRPGAGTSAQTQILQAPTGAVPVGAEGAQQGG